MEKFCKSCSTMTSNFGPKSSAKDGLQTYCRPCKKTQYYKKQKENLQRKKEYYQDNKEKLRQKAKDYRDANYAQVKAREEKYAARPENREKAKARSKKFYESNKEYCAEVVKKYRKTSKGRAIKAQSCAKRRAKLKNQTPKLSKAEAQQVQEIYKLAQTLTKETGVVYHVDHIVPLAKNGIHHPDNLQVITAEENLKKGAKYDT